MTERAELRSGLNAGSSQVAAVKSVMQFRKWQLASRWGKRGDGGGGFPSRLASTCMLAPTLESINEKSNEQMNKLINKWMNGWIGCGSSSGGGKALEPPGREGGREPNASKRIGVFGGC